jgi:N-formylmaleamate deformylase
MAKLYYGHVVVDGHRIHYYRTADEKPPVVLLHGITDNGLCWSRLALQLESDYDVVMVDARGHGLSTAPESGYTPEVQAGDVAALIQSLGLERPALIGHSMGAATAAAVAARYPEWIRGVVLEDPPWSDQLWLETAEQRVTRAEQMRAHIVENKERTVEDLVQLCRGLHPAWDEGDLFQWAKSKHQVKMGIVAGLMEPRSDWGATARQIRVPVLLVTGDPSLGAIVTPQIAQQVSKGWRRSSVAVIPGAGHNIRREQFDLYFDAVNHFLRSLRR